MQFFSNSSCYIGMPLKSSHMQHARTSDTRTAFDWCFVFLHASTADMSDNQKDEFFSEEKWTLVHAMFHEVSILKNIIWLGVDWLSDICMKKYTKGYVTLIIDKTYFPYVPAPWINIILQYGKTEIYLIYLWNLRRMKMLNP